MRYGSLFLLLVSTKEYASIYSLHKTQNNAGFVKTLSIIDTLQIQTYTDKFPVLSKVTLKERV